MENAIQHLQSIDIRALIAIGIMMMSACYGMCKVMRNGFNLINSKIDTINANLKKEIDTINASLNGKIDAVSASPNGKIDKLQETVTDIDRRLCRLEGAFHSKDCCILKADGKQKVVE